jgi:lipoprotein-anchoring transpeptidase ErfK/SrfK
VGLVRTIVAVARCASLLSLLLAGCADHDHAVVISVPEQRMVVLDRGVPLAVYPVSTSKFGLGDVPGRGLTPLGEMEIADKIGDGAPPGAVLKSRQATGEIVAVDAPGRDPIVSRILWLRGLEDRNRNTYGRYIYIHGTPEERNIGRPVSYGCVRMRSRDVIALYDTVGLGARVLIQDEPLAEAAQPLLARGAAIPLSPPAPPVGPAPMGIAGPMSPGN